MVGALSRIGVVPLAGVDNASSDAVGIVCFSAADAELNDFVREASEHGRKRVLALPMPGVAIESAYAWSLMRAGASDVLMTGSAAEMAKLVRARMERWRTVDALVNCEAVKAHLVGSSPAWAALLRQVVEVARFTSAAVLLIGESGTGKELIGRVIHELDPSACEHDLVVVDCTTVVPELAGSELFGHERGAFTGSVGSRDGAVALADGGSLFLDELGDLPLPLQGQLLRVVQEGAFKRVGSDVWRRSRFRLVSATHSNLLEAIRDRQFRQDLYYRVAGWVLHVPPLRQRTEDIMPLARHFFREFQGGSGPIEFDPTVEQYLLTRAYDGNVRDLRQLVARISSRHTGPGPVTVGELPESERPEEDVANASWRGLEFEATIGRAVAMGVGLKEISQAAADTAARLALRNSGNLRAAARTLRVSDRALQLRRAAWRDQLQSL
jgi:transcriptional regulator with GAF, ATPase, and Fis domain